MGLPAFSYVTGGTTVNVNIKGGLANFCCEPVATVNDNLATGGVRERVTQRVDLLITFSTVVSVQGGDFAVWMDFQQWALCGKAFPFQPNLANSAYFWCISDDVKITPKRKAIGAYEVSVAWRVRQNDPQSPKMAGAVMRMFCAIDPTFFEVLTTTLPGGTHGTAYSETLQAGAGAVPVSGCTWSLISAALPTGLALSPGGVLSGTPTLAGDYTFIVCAISPVGYEAFAALELVVS